MRWVKTPHGDLAHVVFDSDPGYTAEGMVVDEKAVTIENPALADRCRNCDKEWRRRGRENKPKPKGAGPGYIPGTRYRPRFTFSDWENAAPGREPEHLTEDNAPRRRRKGHGRPMDGY